MAIERSLGKGKSGEDSLKDKTVLIAGDKPNVLETVEELLSVGRISGANRFDQAKK